MSQFVQTTEKFLPPDSAKSSGMADSLQQDEFGDLLARLLNTRCGGLGEGGFVTSAGGLCSEGPLEPNELVMTSFRVRLSEVVVAEWVS